MEFQKSSELISEQLREGMRYWASGVGVASAAYQGVRHGMTVSSFTSISLEPPLVIVSLNNETRTHDLVLKSGAFGVTLLVEEQQEISNRFAGQIEDEQDRFVGLDTFTLETGSPFLSGGLAFFDCRLIHTFETATTTVMFGEVVAARVGTGAGEKQPLVYQNRAYRRLNLD